MVQTETAQVAKQRKFTGWHMLTLVLLFFGTIFSVNFYMAYSAITSWTGLVVQNSYVASQQFNDRLAASRTQAALNLQIYLTYSEGTLTFHLADENGAPLLTDRIYIALSRPIGVTQDFDLELGPEGVGYAVDHDIPSGVWNVIITATIPGYADFEHRARLIVER